MIVRNKRAMSEIGWVVGGKTASTVIAFAMLRLLTHTLPPALFSRYILLTSALILVASTLSAPVVSASNRFYYEMDRAGKRPAMLASGWIAVFISTVIFVPLADPVFKALGLGLLEIHHVIYAVIAISILPCGYVGIQLLNTARHRMPASILTMLDAALPPSAIALAVVVFGACWELVLPAYTAGKLLVGLAVVVILHRNQLLPSWQDVRLVDWSITRTMLGFGWPAAVGTVALWTISASDRFLLNALLIQKEYVAYYTVAYQIGALIPQMASALFITYAWPHIMQSYIPEKHQLPNISLWCGVFACIAFPILPFAFYFGKPLLGLVAPATYDVALPIIPFSCAALVFYGFEQIVNIPYHLCNKIYYPVGVSAGAGVLNLAMNLWAIPRFGIAGAAYTTLIAYGTQLVVNTILSRRIFKWRIPRIWILIAFIATAITAGLIHPLMPLLAARPFIFSLLAMFLFGLTYALALAAVLAAFRRKLTFEKVIQA